MGDASRRSTEGRPASLKRLTTSSGRAVTIGPDGNAYSVDFVSFGAGLSSRVRKTTPAGVVTVYAGTGPWGYSGDGGPASTAMLNDPRGLALSADGSLYVADTQNHRVRRVDPNRIITTVAGTGVIGTGGDGGPAMAAQVGMPFGIAVGPDGSLLIAQGPQVSGGGSVVRKVATDERSRRLPETAPASVRGRMKCQLIKPRCFSPASTASRSLPTETSTSSTPPMAGSVSSTWFVALIHKASFMPSQDAVEPAPRTTACLQRHSVCSGRMPLPSRRMGWRT